MRSIACQQYHFFVGISRSLKSSPRADCILETRVQDAQSRRRFFRDMTRGRFKIEMDSDKLSMEALQTPIADGGADHPRYAPSAFHKQSSPLSALRSR